MKIQGPVLDRVVTIPNLPMVAPAIGLNQLCIGIVHLLSSQSRKHASLQFVEIVPAKKRNSCYDHDLDTSAISRGNV